MKLTGRRRGHNYLNLTITQGDERDMKRQVCRTIPLAAPVMAACLGMALVLSVLSASARAGFEQFLGRYEGTALAGGGDELSPRDISVSMTPKGSGFNLKWTVVIHKVSGKIKRVEYAIDFLPSKRSGLYRSGMRRNMFGQAVPLDPLKGDPYVWARIEGKVLTVHALIITEDGGYELQIHKRSLTPGGMHLDYFRVKDNEILRTVTGNLKKIE